MKNYSADIGNPGFIIFNTFRGYIDLYAPWIYSYSNPPGVVNIITQNFM
jgi:hypothetical protein